MRTAPATRTPAPGRDAAGAAARRARLAAACVGAVVFAVYLSALRGVGSGDTMAARLLPFSLLRRGTLDLDELAWLRAPDPRPHFLRQTADGHWRSMYPLATPLVVTPLAAPFAWWAAARGMGDDDARFRLLTVVFERAAASLIGALAVAVLLLAAREIAPLRWAVAAALCAAFGTSLWPHSLALWQHPLTALAIAAMALALLRPPTRRRALAAGLLAGAALAARPTAIVLLPVLALLAWRERRAQLWWMIGPILGGAALVAILNSVVLGQPTGGYAPRLPVPALGPMAGLLVSPNRGLFIYTPLAVLAFAALRRGTRPVALRYFALAPLAYVALFGASRSWWGGWCYGPRFFTDLVPLMSLCALPSARQLWTRRAGRGLLVAGALWGVGVQAIGVYFDHDDWNRLPADVDTNEARLWSWSDTQILRGLGAGWHGGELASVLRQLVTDPRPVPLAPLAGSQLAGAIEPVTPPPWHCRLGQPCAAAVRVTNDSPDGMWPAYTDYGPYGVVLGAWWSDPTLPPPARGMWARLPRHLGPHETASLRLPIVPPARAGTYSLTVAVLQNRTPEPPIGGSSITVPVVVE